MCSGIFSGSRILKYLFTLCAAKLPALSWQNKRKFSKVSAPGYFLVKDTIVKVTVWETLTKILKSQYQGKFTILCATKSLNGAFYRICVKDRCTYKSVSSSISGKSVP
jgi:hypothetical protein